MVGDGKHLYDFSESAFGEFEPSPSEILSLAFADQGQLVVAANADGAVRMWSAPNISLWTLIEDMTEPERAPTVLAWTGARSLFLSDATNDVLTVVAERGVHRWKIGMVPDDPEALRQWLRAQAVRLEAPREEATDMLGRLGYFSSP